MVGDKNFNIEITAHGKTDASVGKLQQTLGKITDQLNKLQQVARQARQVANNLSMVGGVVTGAFGVAIATASKYNTEIYETNRKLTNSFVVLQNEVANAVLPVYKDLANITTNLVIKFKNLDDALKNKIIRIAAVSAGLAVFSGILLNVTTRIASLAISVAKMMTTLTKVAFANPWILALAAIIALVATLTYVSYKFATDWNDYFNRAIKPTLVAFEVGLLSLKAQINDLGATFFNSFAIAINQFEVALDKFISAVPGGDFVFGGIKKAIHSVTEELQYMSKVETEASEKTISDIYEKMTTGNSVIANKLLDLGNFTKKQYEEALKYLEFLQRAQKELNLPDEGFFKGFIKGLKDAQEEMSNFYEWGQNVARQAITTIQSYFGDSFYAIFTGQLDKLEDAFSNFANSILRMIANMIAQYLVFSSLSGIFGANSGFTKFYMGTKHQGGYIPLAHTGRAFDEVDVRLQKGEGVVSRRGMNAIGKAGLDAINSGNVPAEQSQPVIVNLQTWDAQDVIRNRNMITAIIQKAIQSNSSLRKVVKNA